MKTITLISICFLLLTVTPLQSKQVVLDDIFNPSEIKIGKNQVYIIQDTEVYIYSNENFKLLKKFGKTGSGPQEFQKSPAFWIPSITLYPRETDLFINSIGKVSYFSKDGTYQKESRTTGVGRFSRYIPFGKHFILIKYTQIDKINYSVSYLTDQNLKEIKELCRVPFPQQTGKKRNAILMAKMADYFDRYAQNERFVLPDEKGNIMIYDKKGTKKISFMPKYTEVKIDKDLSKRLDAFFSNHKFYKRPYLLDKSRGLITLGNSLPLFNDYRLTADAIYIITHHQKAKRYETLVYNYQGKHLKTIYLPLENLDIFNLAPFDIDGNKLYQLVFNEDAEEMNLVISDI